VATDATRDPGGADPRVVDLTLAIAMTLAISVVIAADFEGAGSSGPAAYLFAAGFGALVLVRRRLPRTMLVLTVLGIFVYYAFGFPVIGTALPAVAALYSAAELAFTWWAVGAGTVLVAVSAYFRVIEGQPTAYLYGYELVTNVALVAAAIALGVAVRLTREARAHAQRVRHLVAAEQARTAEQRIQAERMRLARDLHDVVGHNLSVVALHAGVASEAVGRDDAAARTALEQVRAAASGTLHELRATVKLLRRPSDGDAAMSPAGLANLDALVAPARATGLDVGLDLDVPPGTLDATVDAAAFRIVQESLTNVLRHSGARHARVRATVTGGRLHLEVADDGRGTVPGAVPGAGSGIAGMRERAALLGGTLTAGDAPGGGFAVDAELPARLGA
jgi:signal transduction histidine kinase